MSYQSCSSSYRGEGEGGEALREVRKGGGRVNTSYQREGVKYKREAYFQGFDNYFTRTA